MKGLMQQIVELGRVLAQAKQGVSVTFAPIKEEPMKPVCKYCGGTNFFEGPSGGLSINVRCANEACRHWFNWTPAIGEFEDLHRQDPTPQQIADQYKAYRTQEQSLRDRVFAEGRQMKIEGRPAIDCLKHTDNNACGFYKADGGDLVRLCGWLSTDNNLTTSPANNQPAVTDVAPAQLCDNTGVKVENVDVGTPDSGSGWPGGDQ